jgi:hypothetical protein
MIAQLLQALCACRMSDAEFLYDLGKIIHRAERGNGDAQAAFDSIRASAEAQQLTDKFLEDCKLAKEFHQPEYVAVQFCALVEDWSRLRIQGEITRRKENK